MLGVATAASPGSLKDRSLDPRIDRQSLPRRTPRGASRQQRNPSDGPHPRGRETASPAPLRPQLEQLNRALVVLAPATRRSPPPPAKTSCSQRACEAIVRFGGYRLSWAGYAEHDDDKRVRPVAQFGFDQGYVEHVRHHLGRGRPWPRSRGHRDSQRPAGGGAAHRHGPALRALARGRTRTRLWLLHLAAAGRGRRAAGASW